VAGLVAISAFLVFVAYVFVTWPNKVYCRVLKKPVGKNMLQSTSIDFIIRIKHAYAAKRRSLSSPSSKFSVNLAQILKKHNFITNYSVSGKIKKTISVTLKYDGQEPAISQVKIFSKPGRRWYEKASSLPWGQSPSSLIIISTSKGLMSQRRAVKQNIGGELIAQIN